MSHIDGFISGTAAGAAGLIVGHPFDTIKVRLQTTSGYKGFSDCLKKTLAKEGARGLYKGMMAPMVSTSAMNAVFFGVYSSVLQSIDNDMDRPKVSSTYIAGTVSGLLAGCISGPVELIKCRLQVSAGTRPLTNKDVIVQILRSEGIMGMKRGLGLTICRELISCGLYFSAFEFIIQWFRGPHKRLTDLNSFHLLLAGGCSGMISWGINYPVDVVKSRIQIDGMEGARKYRNGRECCRYIYNKSGFNGFWRGVTATLVRAFPTNAAMLPVYSVTMALLANLRGEQEAILQEY